MGATSSRYGLHQPSKPQPVDGYGHRLQKLLDPASYLHTLDEYGDPNQEGGDDRARKFVSS